MKVGVLKDIKVGEYRVIATPAEVSMLVGDGNEFRRARAKVLDSRMRHM